MSAPKIKFDSDPIPYDGGAAFPGEAGSAGYGYEKMQMIDQNGNMQFVRLNQGMTLRDYFAAKAMQGMASQAEHWSQRDIPKMAYEIADAMIAERIKTK